MIILRWNKYVEEWVMLDDKMNEMYRFRDCRNINRLYRNLDKEKINIYAQEPLEPIQQNPINE